MNRIDFFVDRELEKIEHIFMEESQELHKQVIVGSPVDTGRFKTSWQLRESNPRTLRFRLYNPIQYGMILWRYRGSNQGWSPKGGDMLVENYLRRMRDRLKTL